jgi:putative SOS response-associated peptidase YedK
MRQLFDVPAENSALGNLPGLEAIFPKYEAPIVTIETTGDRALIRSSWGFLTPNKSKKTGNWLKPKAWNNTRDDKIQTSGLWKTSFEARRCLIPATAYAEATGRNPATYHWFRVRDQEAFAFAGIWQRRSGLVGETDVDGIFHSMVTTTPCKLAAKYHNRMPVILALNNYAQWLEGDPEDAAKLIQPYSGELEMFAEGLGLTKEPMSA